MMEINIELERGPYESKEEAFNNRLNRVGYSVEEFRLIEDHTAWIIRERIKRYVVDDDELESVLSEFNEIERMMDCNIYVNEVKKEKPKIFEKIFIVALLFNVGFGIFVGDYARSIFWLLLYMAARD